MIAKHSPGKLCVVCEGLCLRAHTIDEANTSLAVATTRSERIAALEALASAASFAAAVLREIDAAEGNDQSRPAPYYIGGPYPDGSFSVCEVDTGRVVQKLGGAA